MLFSKKINNEDDLGEKKAFERYRKALNKMCKDCQYQDCEYRNKREVLKMQKIGFKEISCQKEYDIRLDTILKRKLP